MNNSSPDNQTPAWFADAAAPIVPQPTAKSSANKKRILIILSVLASIVLITGGIALYVMSVENAKVMAVKDFQTKYTEFYAAFSSIDDRLEPEGVDPADTSSRWQAYKESIASLKDSPLYSSQKQVIDAIESESSTYDTYVNHTLPLLATYMTNCTYNSEAGAADIAEACITRLQTIAASNDTLSQSTAQRLLTILSGAKSSGVMNDAEIANAGTLEAALFSVPDNFATAIGTEAIKLGNSVGIDFTDE